MILFQYQFELFFEIEGWKDFIQYIIYKNGD